MRSARIRPISTKRAKWNVRQLVFFPALFISLALVLSFTQFTWRLSSLTEIQSLETQSKNNTRIQIFVNSFPNATGVHDLNDFGELYNLVNFNLPIPRNLNIAFMGDSLTRYQYIDLVYFLSHSGRWIRRDDSPNMVLHEGSFNHYFNFTNSILRPYEECDCYRKGYIVNGVENRYFYDKERNNRVSFLGKFGDVPFKSQWNVSDLFDDHGAFEVSQPKFVYQGNWVDSIKDFVCKMEPKPSVFVFNTGLHNHAELTDPRIQKEAVDALKACEIISIYKTTTSRELEKYEEQLCNQTDFCFDVSWTKKPFVPSHHYADDNHFTEPLYSMLNIYLLSMLAEITEL